MQCNVNLRLLQEGSIPDVRIEGSAPVAYPCANSKVETLSWSIYRATVPVHSSDEAIPSVSRSKERGK